MVENSKPVVGKKKNPSPSVSESTACRQSEVSVKVKDNPEEYQKACDVSPESSDESESSEDESFDHEMFTCAKDLIMKIYISIYDKYVEKNKNYFRTDFREHIKQYMPKRYRTFNDTPTSSDPLTPLRLRRFDTVCMAESRSSDMFPCLVQMFPSSAMCPRMRYYIHVDRNIQTDDTLRLSNFPYSENSEDLDKFYHELRKAYPEGIHGERRGWGKPITDELLFLLVQEVLNVSTKDDFPTAYIFKAIYKLFPTKLMAGELEEIYPTLARRFDKRASVKKRIKSVTDVDHSISSLYCGKCNQFFCELHALDGTDKVAINRNGACSDDEEIEACSPDCYRKGNELNMKEVAKDKLALDRLGEVCNDGEPIKLLEMFLNLNKFSSCCLAKILSKHDPNRSWACREIYIMNTAMKRKKANLSPEDTKEKKRILKDLPTGHKSLARMTNGEINNSAKLKPCVHEGACTDCVCSQENTPCTKFCKCSEKCKRKLRGCVCLPGQCGTNLCPCYLAKWECDSDNCRNCVSGSSKFSLPVLKLYPRSDPELNYYRTNSESATSSDSESLKSDESTTARSLCSNEKLSDAEQLSEFLVGLTSSPGEANSIKLDEIEDRKLEDIVKKLSTKCSNIIPKQTSTSVKSDDGVSEHETIEEPKDSKEKKVPLFKKHGEITEFSTSNLTENVKEWLNDLKLPKECTTSRKKKYFKSGQENLFAAMGEPSIHLGSKKKSLNRRKKPTKFHVMNVRAYEEEQKKVLSSVFGNGYLEREGIRKSYGNELEEERCNNCRIQNGQFKHLKVGVSSVAGFGCFLCEPAAKGDLIAEYTGEVISRWEAERRGLIYDEFKCSFIFALNNSQSVDATRMGNTIRFANHSDNGNCYSQIIIVNGEHRIGIFAKTDLPSGEEIFFDYQYNKNCKEKYVPKGSRDV